MNQGVEGYIPNLNDFSTPTPYVEVRYANGLRLVTHVNGTDRRLVNVGSIGHVQHGLCIPPLVQAIREANKQ